MADNKVVIDGVEYTEMTVGEDELPPWVLDENGNIPEEILEDTTNEPQVPAGPTTAPQMADFGSQHGQIQTESEWRWYNPFSWNWSKANPMNWFGSDDKNVPDMPFPGFEAYTNTTTPAGNQGQTAEKDWQWYNPLSWDWSKANPMNWFGSDENTPKPKTEENDWKWYNPLSWDWSKANPMNWFATKEKETPSKYGTPPIVPSQEPTKDEPGIISETYDKVAGAVKGAAEMAYDAIPNELGGRTSEEKRQGVNFQPNIYQKIMPPFMGGWTKEQLETAKKAAEQAGYIDRPNWWQRRMPTFMGGWSNEEIKRSEDLSIKHGDLPSRPNLWERFMPTWLGGASKEEVDRYDKVLETRKAANPQMSAYKRHAHEWIGGASDEEIKKFDQEVALGKKVVGNVTVGDLLNAGFTQEQVAKMQEASKAKIDAQIKAEAGNNPMGLSHRLGQVATPVQISAKELGITNQQMNQIIAINNAKAQQGGK